MECRLCKIPLEGLGLRKDSTFCCINHRSLFHKWKTKGLNEEEIVQRYKDLRSGGVITPVKTNSPQSKSKTDNNNNDNQDRVTLSNKSLSKTTTKTTQVSPKDNFISQQKTLKDYGISRSTLYRWVKSKLIRQYKVDRLVFYNSVDIDKMINSNQTT